MIGETGTQGLSFATRFDLRDLLTQMTLKIVWWIGHEAGQVRRVQQTLARPTTSRTLTFVYGVFFGCCSLRNFEAICTEDYPQ